MSRHEGLTEPGSTSVALSGVFAGMGLSAALPPAALPVLMSDTGLAPAAASLVISGMFAGLFAGVTAAALASTAVGPKRLLMAGAWLQGAGLVLMASAPGRFGVGVAAVVLGMGFGATELSAIAVVRGLEAVTGRDLTRRTGLVALTAAGTPVALGLLVAVGHWRALFVAAAALQLVTALALLGGQPVPARPSTSWRRALRPGRHHLAVAAYVGAETLLVAWVARVAATSLHLAVGPTVAATAAFWIAIAVGRRISSRLLAAAVPAGRLLAGTLTLAIAALVGAAATGGDLRAAAVFVALVGAGPVYPLVLATAPSTADARVLGPLIAAGSLGGTLVIGMGTVAYEAGGLPGVLLLAAGMLAGCLLTGARPRRPAASARASAR